MGGLYASLRNPSAPELRGGGPRVTWRSTVAAHVIACHPLHLQDDLFGQFLDDVVLPGAVVTLKCIVQSFFLAVLQYRHPSGQTATARVLEGEYTHSHPWPWPCPQYLHLTFLFVLGLEVVRPVICTARGDLLPRGQAWTLWHE